LIEKGTKIWNNDLSLTDFGKWWMIYKNLFNNLRGTNIFGVFVFFC
jgi:hypothetical protein